MSKKTSTQLCGVLCFLLLSTPNFSGFHSPHSYYWNVHGRPFQDLRGMLQAKLDSLHAVGQFPGATAGFALADGTTFGIATGYADLATKRKMAPTDLMLQGSVGKTYVAAIALQLIDEGRLSLDDKIEKHLGAEPWFKRLPNGPDITVRMLMNHTSGLVRYEFNEKFVHNLKSDPDKFWKPEELVAYILDTQAPFAAGKDWDYSDTNYIVLGMIIVKITGKKYYDLLRERIFTPLKLQNTLPSDSRTIRGLVQGYAGTGNPFTGTDEVIQNGKFAINPQFEWTGGGVASTTEDLARWGKMLYEGMVVDSSLLPMMFEGVPAKLGPNTKYGLGVIIRQTQFGISYGHSGYFPGYLTEMMYFPEMKVAIAVQVNTSEFQKLGRPLIRFIGEFVPIIRDHMMKK
ncbi:MAG: beta-lactamase family protein [Ignavibacteria bacterium]|nr:beta-lactamase family protein [Ignavibacteria bacterium]